MPTYDIVVVGGGTAGLVTAAGSAGIGARVALVERARLGGECLWTGCVPSKALIAAARAASDAKTAQRIGVSTTGDVEFDRVMNWVREAQRRVAPHDSPERFRSLGVDVVQGNARFSGERTLSVEGTTLSAKRIVVATGSSPAIPPIDGLRDAPYLTNETIFDLERQPKTLLVLGAGPVGLELAQAFVRLGTQVTVVEGAAELLSNEDQELAVALGRRLADDGVSIHLGASVSRVTHGRGCVTLHVGEGAKATRFEGDALLVATGRTPRVSDLDVDRAGIRAEKSGVVVSAKLATTAGGVWAAGDCVGPLRFTHVADYQARLVVRNAFFPFRAKADYSVVPWVTFTDPELAHVGLTEREARDRLGDRVRVWRRAFADVDRAIVDDRTDGLVKLITDAKGRILGGHALGHGAGSIIGEIALAMKQGMSVKALANTIHAYPTYPEAIRQAAELQMKARFTGPAKRIARWFARR